ncbi:hypothetical protein AB6806_23920 [Bosea sp. RCC_152_1]|uniref:hypothetical protein n=1 Tax=Bosea sp. RCC_152_1 TaxID=3239228 RepID=UPI00352327C2
MMRQAIVTKYLGPTNSRGSRIKATASAGSVTIPYSYDLRTEDAHAKAAKVLARKMGWAGHWHGGGTPEGTGYVFVNSTASQFAIWGDEVVGFTTSGETL